MSLSQGYSLGLYYDTQN